ncbi:MAG TPA: NUDIX domain-containing protein [Anaerolineaceae bacterium]|nr:NUDIX domain-containing protein [Anaerolineaceae bacterium]HPN51884.1 NUDIX domain-containing protein [Anaerolineaceae bacterium]
MMTTIGVFANIFDAEGRILCVKRAYGPKNWTTPGGRMEAGESPEEAVVREVEEETGYIVRAGQLIGSYSKPWCDNLVLSINAEITGRKPWQPDDEIAEIGFYPPEALPEPMHPGTRLRLMDAFAGQAGQMRTLPEAPPLPQT